MVEEPEKDEDDAGGQQSSPSDFMPEPLKSRGTMEKKDENMGQMSRPILCYSRILLGEITSLLMAMRRSAPRWSSHNQDGEQDPLVFKLRELQIKVTVLGPNDQLDPHTFLEPFLAVIRSEDTTGPVTKSALAAVNRMLSYGLLDPDSNNAVSTVEAIAAAVTHARFVGTDQGADEVVLWEILTVLRTLILGPVGHLLTNESVCEILNSSFRICFETRLSELLRNCTEDALRHMVQLLFARLPQFKDDPQGQGQHTKRLKMRTGGESKSRRGKGRFLQSSSVLTPPAPSDVPSDGDMNKNSGNSVLSEEQASALASLSLNSSVPDCANKVNNEIQTPTGDTASVDSGIMETASPGDPVDISHAHLAPELQGSLENIEIQGNEVHDVCLSNASEPETVQESAGCECSETNTSHSSAEVISSGEADNESTLQEVKELKHCDGLQNHTNEIKGQASKLSEKGEFVNMQGVKFTQEGVLKEGNVLVAYGMPCVREVFRFLISLTSPTNDQNTPTMILTALNLITVALEVGADHINGAPSLLVLLKDQLCRNLFMLLKPEVRPPVFMASMRLCTLVFESLRPHLKFQLEMFLNKLSEIVTSETPAISYILKELALETIVQLWRIPGLITELFLNYDCDLYSSNMFEDLTKVLSKNAFPVQGLYSTNLLSLEALVTVIETIDGHCPSQKNLLVKSQLNKKEDKAKNVEHPVVVAPISSGCMLGFGLRGG